MHVSNDENKDEHKRCGRYRYIQLNQLICLSHHTCTNQAYLAVAASSWRVCQAKRLAWRSWVRTRRPLVSRAWERSDRHEEKGSGLVSPNANGGLVSETMQQYLPRDQEGFSCHGRGFQTWDALIDLEWCCGRRTPCRIASNLDGPQSIVLGPWRLG